MIDSQLSYPTWLKRYESLLIQYKKPVKCQVYVSSEQREGRDVRNHVASGVVGPKSLVYHWPDTKDTKD